jgi:hypothetical protein
MESGFDGLGGREWVERGKRIEATSLFCNPAFGNRGERRLASAPRGRYGARGELRVPSRPRLPICSPAPGVWLMIVVAYLLGAVPFG